MKKVLAIVVVVLIGIMAFGYFGVYSEGVRAGTIIKVSRRGTIFKTYEGQLNLNVFGAVKGKSPLNESFEFSIPDDPELLKKIDAVTGRNVKLYYKEKYFLFPWLGETKYMATDVELSDSDAPSDKSNYLKD
ncbi:6-phosphogluconate dehydrogenase [bacterium SCSIO 12643]|nr:6-phosphogluconate dehydrogenase [bacterium SCSIO 12643]